MKTLQNLIMMLMISSVACWAEGQIGRITGNAVQIRAKGANFYERLGEFSAGTEVNVLSESNGWSEIQLPPTVRLWIQEEYLDDDGMVNSDVACLYAGQSTRFSKVKVLTRGTMLNVAGTAVNKLIPVYAPKGATGWVSSSYVELAQNAAEAVEVPATAAVDLADAVQQTMENNQRVQQELQEQNQKLEELEKQRAVLDAEEVRRVAEIDEATRQLEELERQRMAQEDELARQEAKLTELERKNQELQETQNRRQAELEAAMAQGEKDLEAQHQQYDELRQQLADAEDEVVALQAKVKQIDVKRELAELEYAQTAEAGKDSDATAVDGETENDEVGKPAAVSDECTLRGVIVALGMHAVKEASYALCSQEGDKYVPICYLASRGIVMSRWNRKNVVVTGKVSEESNLKLPLLNIKSVMADKQ